MGGLGDIIAATHGPGANLYAIFGVKNDASDSEIKKAYHKLALKVSVVPAFGTGQGRSAGGQARRQAMQRRHSSAADAASLSPLSLSLPPNM